VTQALTLSLTPKALARRVAREQLRDDRTLLKKVRTSLSPSKARKRSPAKTLQDHEERIRAIESVLFGKGHSSQKRQWLLEGIGKTARVARPKPLTAKIRALGAFLDDWETKHGELTPDELAEALLLIKAPKRKPPPPRHAMRSLASLREEMRAVARGDLAFSETETARRRRETGL